MWDLILRGVVSYVVHSKPIIKVQLGEDQSSTCFLAFSRHVMLPFEYWMVYLLAGREVSTFKWPLWTCKTLWSLPHIFTTVPLGFFYTVSL